MSTITIGDIQGKCHLHKDTRPFLFICRPNNGIQNFYSSTLGITAAVSIHFIWGGRCSLRLVFCNAKSAKCKVQSAMKSPIFKVVLEREKRSGVDVSDISVYICLIDIRDGSCKPVYGGVDHLKALSSAKTGCRPRFFMN